MKPIKYRGYTIEYNPKPIPLRGYDYDYWCDDEELGGCAASVEQAKAEIDLEIEENNNV